MFQKGQIVNCQVKKVYRNFLVVELPNKHAVSVSIKQISDYYVSSLKNFFSQESFYNFQVLGYEKVNGVETPVLTWKNLNPRFLRNPFDFVIKETQSGFRNLKKFVFKAIKNDKS